VFALPPFPTNINKENQTDTSISKTECGELEHETVKKRKAVLLQAWSGLEDSRKLRFQDFMTTAQDGGKVVDLMHRPPLPPGNTPGTHFC
jgi:hypothetical protein